MSQRIEPTQIPGYKRESDVSIEEAIFYILNQGEKLYPTELFEILNTRFIPHFSFYETKEVVVHMIISNKLIMTPDRYIVKA